MSRRPKQPQYHQFNMMPNCYGRFCQSSNQSLKVDSEYKQTLIELGAGTSKVALAYAAAHPDWLILAIDQKSDRLVKAAKVAKSNNLSNIKFIQSDLRQLQDVCPEIKADSVWITFPDPYPRKADAKHRLVGLQLLQTLTHFFKPKAKVYFKTDNFGLYARTLEVANPVPGLRIVDYSLNVKTRKIQSLGLMTITDYESRFESQGISTKFIAFDYNGIVKVSNQNKYE